MKVTEQYFPVVLFIMIYNMVLPFYFVGEILCNLQMEVIEQFFFFFLPM